MTCALCLGPRAVHRRRVLGIDMDVCDYCWAGREAAREAEEDGKIRPAFREEAEE